MKTLRTLFKVSKIIRFVVIFRVIPQLVFEIDEDSLKNLAGFLNSEERNSSIIRQKSESQNGGNKKTKRSKFCKKQTFLTLLPYYRTYLI